MGDKTCMYLSHRAVRSITTHKRNVHLASGRVLAGRTNGQVRNEVAIHVTNPVSTKCVKGAVIGECLTTMYT